MTPPLTPQTVQRLAMVRFLFDQGVELARRAEPLSAPAVNSFQDAVEQFLRLAAEHHQVTLPTQVNFADYWSRLEPALGAPLPSKNAMDRMNRLRVSFKHHGAVPSGTAIRQACADVTSFFRDATMLVFSVDFRSVDMGDLVTREATVASLQEARTRAEEGEIGEALGYLSYGFEELIDHYNKRYSAEALVAGPLNFGPQIQLSYGSHADQSDRRQAFEAGLHATAELQQAVRVLAAGADHYDYARFKLLVPTIRKLNFSNGTTGAQALVADFHRARTQEDYEFCRGFVISIAILLAKADEAMNLVVERKEMGATPRGKSARVMSIRLPADSAPVPE